MKSLISRRRVLAVMALALGLVAVGVGIWIYRPGVIWKIATSRRVKALEMYQDVRWGNARKLDLRQRAEILPALWFNQSTRWPAADKLPPGLDPAAMLTNAMNPGLGVRELHRAGVTGQGVHVAIIDYDIQGTHPEYANNLVEIQRINTKGGPSMHGPAVASLLVGAHCGTAPGARLHFLVVPDGVADATHDAQALHWIIKRNEGVAPNERIRIVSVSSAPSGRAQFRFRNPELWDAAVRDAEAAGLLVIDGTEHHGFLGPCNLDRSDPENPAKCRVIYARGAASFFKGRLLVPTGPRTTAEEYYRGENSYQYCGLQKDTTFSSGSSWAMPYASGVAALGLQLRPELSAADLKRLLFESAYVLESGEKVINPKAFIAAVRSSGK